MLATKHDTRSSANMHSHKNKGCVKEGTGRTGEGLRDIMKSIDTLRPSICVLENVTGLTKPNAPDEGSDADFIVQSFQEL